MLAALLIDSVEKLVSRVPGEKCGGICRKQSGGGERNYTWIIEIDLDGQDHSHENEEKNGSDAMQSSHDV